MTPATPGTQLLTGQSADVDDDEHAEPRPWYSRLRTVGAKTRPARNPFAARSEAR